MGYSYCKNENEYTTLCEAYGLRPLGAALEDEKKRRVSYDGDESCLESLLIFFLSHRRGERRGRSSGSCSFEVRPSEADRRLES